MSRIMFSQGYSSILKITTFYKVNTRIINYINDVIAHKSIWLIFFSSSMCLTSHSDVTSKGRLQWGNGTFRTYFYVGTFVLGSY